MGIDFCLKTKGSRLIPHISLAPFTENSIFYLLLLSATFTLNQVSIDIRLLLYNISFFAPLVDLSVLVLTA